MRGLSGFATLLAGVLSAVLHTLAISGIWWLAWVSLTPLCVAVVLQRKWWMAAVTAWIFGGVIFLVSSHPLWVFSFGGSAVLAAYHALLLMVPAVVLQGAHRRWALPLWVLWPLVWVTFESLGALGALAAPVGYLAVIFHEQLVALQVLDLGGTLILSFAIAIVQGLMGDLWIAAFQVRACRTGKAYCWPWIGAGAATAIWSAIVVYGVDRLDEIKQSLTVGPRVIVIQPDVPFVRGIPTSYDPELYLERMKSLTTTALATYPDSALVLWPEALDAFPLESDAAIHQPFNPRIERWLRDEMGLKFSTQDLANYWTNSCSAAHRYATKFLEWAAAIDTPIWFGMLEKAPTEADQRLPFEVRNIIAEIGGGIPRPSLLQAKRRLYPLGEYAPWENAHIERILDRWLPPNARIQPGIERSIREIGSFGDVALIAICSEILSPKECGVFLLNDRGGKVVHYLLNPSNEGAFLRNRAQIFTLASARFRAIEARVGVARSSNTGISGFISPTGEFHSLVTNPSGNPRSGLGAPELDAIQSLMKYRLERQTDPDFVARVREQIAAIAALRSEAGIEGWASDYLLTSPISTLYQRWGQWVGWLSGIAVIGLAVSLFIPGSGIEQ